MVNPPINIIRNNNLKFDLSDASLSGYQFKIYTDNQFSNEYVSSYDSRTFNVVGLGTIGVSTSASLTLNYSQNIPTKLFYGLESLDISLQQIRELMLILNLISLIVHTMEHITYLELDQQHLNSHHLLFQKF